MCICLQSASFVIGHVKYRRIYHFHDLHVGEECGPVLEAIVAHMKSVSQQTEQKLRMIGLSTTLANAKDMAEWLNVDQVSNKVLTGSYNWYAI